MYRCESCNKDLETVIQNEISTSMLKYNAKTEEYEFIAEADSTTIEIVCPECGEEIEEEEEEE